MSENWHEKAFYRVSVKALIRNEKNEILMVSEKSSDFSLPGGGWDYGEDLHSCLVRELEEEIALKSTFSYNVITAVPFYNQDKAAWQMWVACEIYYENPLEFSIGKDADVVQWVAENDIDGSTLAGKLIRHVIDAKESNDTV